MSRRKNRGLESDPGTGHVPVTAPAAPAWARPFVFAVLGVGALVALWALAATADAGGATRQLAAQWGQYAAAIVQTKVAALWHAALMTLAAGAAVWLLLLARTRTGWLGRWVPWALVFLVAADAVWLSSRYIKTMPLSALAENDVIRLLKTAPERRVALLSQDGFYNQWLTFLFPYHGIQSVNITQMPRMPGDYKQFLGAAARNLPRFWELAAVEYVLAPAQAWQQMQQPQSPFRGALDPVLAYNVAPSEGGVVVMPASAGQPGQHLVLRVKAPAPRFALVAGWEPADDVSALTRLFEADRDPFQRVLVASTQQDGLPPAAGQGVTGTVQCVAYRSGLVKVRATADVPALLRFSEKYDPNWRVSVDGRPAPLRRVDFLFQGVWLDAGEHEVIFRFAPDARILAAQATALLMGLLAVIGMVVNAARSRFKRDAPGNVQC